jgi:hypothetical protein
MVKPTEKDKVITAKSIEEKRNGGKIALLGFSYQLLYSCYMVLSFLDRDSKFIKFEGIEDIDTYKTMTNDNEEIQHIQLKYSENKQDASFFDSILKNYLEVYLTDKKNSKRFFKLVYDAEISKGNLNKLINGKMDLATKKFWDLKIKGIQNDNSDWDWLEFNSEDFLKQLKFKKVPKKRIALEIERIFIDKYNVDTGNEKLFLNSLFYHVFHKAQKRELIKYNDLIIFIQEIKDHISKGYHNPAYHWIEKIDFDKLCSCKIDEDYFEGKKTTPIHIANKLPVRRNDLESIIEETIDNNIITIIKASSGQGKTTLAWQVAYNLQNEYVIYQLKWCRDSKEIDNIVEYFNSRLKLGEKVLIVLDNLDADLQAWNKLVQLLYEKLKINYKVLVTTREDDWYTYGGDQSNLHKLKIVDIYMNVKQAEDIYNKFNEKNKVHEDIKNWQSAWEQVADRKLLIEYVYLLTHGEMLEERITNQVKLLNQSTDGKVKIELLRIIALADTIGIKIKGQKVIKHLHEKIESIQDLNEIVISVKNEYFIEIEDGESYIEGLHPIRSQHLVNRLHQHQSIADTLKILIEIIDEFYVGQLYSQMPHYINSDKDEYYEWLVNKIQNKPYSYMIKTIQGIFSGYILKYFKQNRTIFDDANRHGGFTLFLGEVNPWNTEVKTFESLLKIMPENENIKYLSNLSESLSKINFREADFYSYAYYLAQTIQIQPLKRIINELGILDRWLTRFDEKFTILKILDIKEVWKRREEFNLEELSILIYQYHENEFEVYTQFVNTYKSQIFSFLKIKTDSLCLYEEDSSIQIQYVLLPNDMENANQQSVDRIDKICKILPIYNKYCTNAIQPNINFLASIKNGVPDNSQKAMPIENVKLSFNVDLAMIWRKSILAHYEIPSVYEWQKYWVDIRRKIIEFLKLNIEILECKLKRKIITKLLCEKLYDLKNGIIDSLIMEVLCPHENRPFEEASKISKFANEMKSKYFGSIQYYVSNFSDIILQENQDNKLNLLMINLKTAREELLAMQGFYNQACENSIRYFNTNELEKEEFIWIDRLINLDEYYITHSGIQNNYSRQALKVWFEKKERNFMDTIYECIKEIEINCGFKVIKPQKVIVEDNLSTVVVAIEDFDITSLEKSMKLIYACTSFIKVNIEFLLFIFTNTDGIVEPIGLKVSKDFLIQFNKVIEDGDDETSLEKVIKPLPIELTHKYLDVFDYSFRLKKNLEKNKFDSVFYFVMLIWKYSQYVMNLDVSISQEFDYLSTKKQQIEKELNIVIEKFDEQISLELIDELKNLKYSVLDNNNRISDGELNCLVDKIIIEVRKGHEGT